MAISFWPSAIGFLLL